MSSFPCCKRLARGGDPLLGSCPDLQDLSMDLSMDCTDGRAHDLSALVFLLGTDALLNQVSFLQHGKVSTPLSSAAYEHGLMNYPSCWQACHNSGSFGLTSIVCIVMMRARICSPLQHGRKKPQPALCSDHANAQARRSNRQPSGFNIFAA